MHNYHIVEYWCLLLGHFYENRVDNSPYLTTINCLIHFPMCHNKIKAEKNNLKHLAFSKQKQYQHHYGIVLKGIIRECGPIWMLEVG